MTLAQFQAFVQQNIRWFDGVAPETQESLRSAEHHLGYLLPPSLKWLLSEWGYSEACGIGSLEEAVARTLELRKTIGLPVRYLILNDWGDAGLVYLDAKVIDTNDEYPLYWANGYDVECLAVGKSLSADVDVFEDYPAWTKGQLQIAQDEAEAEQESP